MNTAESQRTDRLPFRFLGELNSAHRTNSVLLWILGGMIVAGAGVGSYLTQPPPPEEYRATAVVRPPTIAQDSPGAVNLFVIDLPERVTADATMVHVLEEVPGIDPDEYLEGIGARRRGATSLVEIFFVHPDRQMARETVEAVANRLIDESARGEFDKAAYLLEQARDRLEVAQQDLTSLTLTHDFFEPRIEYAKVLDGVAALDRQIATAIFEEADESLIETLNEQRAALVAERDRLGAVLLTYDMQLAELDRAREEVEQARSRYVEAEFEYTFVNTPNQLIVARNVAQFVDNTARLQQAALAAAIALVATLVIMVPIGSWLRRRRLAGRHRDSGDGTSRPYDTSLDPTVDIYDRVYGRR